ncbi:cell adhesion molecule CEACAM7-like isoform X2 [Rhinoderma darwinii]|uniref:cell adhesion molecule CEACAM7-like isoform X2 n=1 Tax=Rhinoderma darwinii TaxID=43563 RepID=UPI003F6790C2
MAKISGVFVLWMNLTTGINIEFIPVYPLINQSVHLNVTEISGLVRSFCWYKGEDPSSQNLILCYSRQGNPPETHGPLYFPRVSSFPNASLEISKLHTEDQGYYTVQVVTRNDPKRRTAHLLVYATVTKPVIRSSTLYPIGNDKITLTCDTMYSEKIIWGRNGKIIPPGVIKSPDNRTITFPTIKPLDGGLYWCEAENFLSKITSDIYTLNVYCICGSTSDLNAGEIAGVIIGTLLVIVILVGGIFLLLFFKRRPHPVKEEPREEANKKQDPPIEYYNVQAMTRPYPANQESAYMDLQYASQDTYSDLQS